MGKGRSVTVVVALIGAAVVFGLARFNYNPALYSNMYDRYLVVNLIALLLVPMLSITLLLKAEPAAFGMTSVNSKKTWAWVGLLTAGVLVLIFLVARMSSFQGYYPIFKNFSGFEAAFAGYPNTNPFEAAPWLMVYAEASYGLYLFCWEFFFRGYLLFGLQKSLGSIAAVILQAVAFGLLHWGKPEMIPSFAGGIILGILALRSKSFVPCFVLHWAASIGMDVLVVALRPH